jgi:FkbM family methyltransferase
MSDYIVSYAQNREDIILSSFFEGVKEGFYVDVGANHPDILSITKFFYDKGWHGINIEPNAQLHKLIQQQRPRDINLNVGAADKPGELVLREYPGGDGLSTFSKEAQDLYQEKSSIYRKNTRRYEDRKVAVKPLKQIFEENEVGTINFMTIDVEGFEYNVIKGNDWSKYRPQVICIEANHVIQDWRPLLEEAQYELIFFDGLNDYYVAKEHPELAAKFSYVNTVLLDKPIISADAQQQFIDMQRQINEAENKLSRHILIEQNLRGEIHQLHAQLAASKRLRSLVKQVVAAFNRAVLIHIERLNKPKVKKQPPLVFTESMGLDALLTKVKLYDLNQYYNAKSSPPIMYRAVRGCYVACYDTMKLIARKAIRILRSAK